MVILQFDLLRRLIAKNSKNRRMAKPKLYEEQQIINKLEITTTTECRYDFADVHIYCTQYLYRFVIQVCM